MKKKLLKILRLIRIDVLLLGLAERFLTALSKKLGEWKALAEASLARCKNCNEKVNKLPDVTDCEF